MLLIITSTGHRHFSFINSDDLAVLAWGSVAELNPGNIEILA